MQVVDSMNVSWRYINVYYLIPLVFLTVYWIVPLPIKIVLLVIDFIVPDPIPAIDEILMAIIFIDRLKKVLFIQKFIHKHKILFAIFLILSIIIIAFLVSWILTFL